MNFKKILFTILLSALFCIFLINESKAQINAGFVQGLWYSKSSFFAGETIRMYSAIQNQSDFDITGKVEFIVNEEVIGSSNFSAISGRLVESWVDWTAKKGKSSVYVRVVNAKKYVLEKTPEPITLAYSKSQTDVRTIDVDTDKDGVGDKEDEDDDNDTLSDEEEVKIGTDPLKKDTDGDGINDEEEKKRGSDPLKTDNTSYKSEQYAIGSIVSNSMKLVGDTPSVKKETSKIENIRKSIIAVPKKLSQTADSVAGQLKNIQKKTDGSSSYSTFLDFLIFIFEHKILLVLVILAILALSYKIFKFFYRLSRRL